MNDRQVASTRSTKIKIGRVHTRPLLSRILGWTLFVLGVVVLVVNWIEEFSSLEALPGGHSAFYLAGGIVAAVAGLWAAGVMDAK